MLKCTKMIQMHKPVFLERLVYTFVLLCTIFVHSSISYPTEYMIFFTNPFPISIEQNQNLSCTIVSKQDNTASLVLIKVFFKVLYSWSFLLATSMPL